MKRYVQTLLFLAFCLIAIPTVNAQTGVTGIFENLTANKQSGDLDGMRVVIVSAGGGYHAIVQIAQGGADDPTPEFVPVKVKGKNIEFTVGESKYTGIVTAAGLKLKATGGTAERLKRKSCSSYFR